LCLQKRDSAGVGALAAGRVALPGNLRAAFGRAGTREELRSMT
jgi:hypothetical protein